MDLPITTDSFGWILSGYREYENQKRGIAAVDQSPNYQTSPADYQYYSSGSSYQNLNYSGYGTPVSSFYCFSCNDTVHNTERIILSDGGSHEACERKICRECFSTAVMDTDSCQTLVDGVLTFFDEQLNMPITESVAVYLVEANTLPMQSAYSPTHGITLKGYKGSVVSVKDTWVENGRVFTEKESRKPSSDITIQVSYGSPKAKMGEILAHEFMHAWLALEGVSGELEYDLEEGVCQVIAYQWLEWFGEYEASSSQFSQNQIRQLINNIVTDAGCCGRGFRSVQSAVSKHGLREVVRHIVDNKALPHRGSDSGSDSDSDSD